MRVLITWGSKLGGTEGIARIIADELTARGFEVDARPASARAELPEVDAVIIGGALYANRWHPAARRFVRRRAAALQRVPVWFFSSGPLDDSAEHRDIPPPPKVRALMDLVGAQGHSTFGGRLAPDAEGFPAHAMAQKMSGDWRNPERIRSWATAISRQLPNARPRPAVEPAGRSPARLLMHGLIGWALCGLVMAWLLRVASIEAAVVIHAILAPLIFLAIAYFYFRPPGAREPLSTAFGFTSIVLFLDLIVVAGVIQRSFEMFTSFAGSWLPMILIFGATWATGALMSTLPWPTKSASEAKA